MNDASAFDIAASGMAAQRLSMDVIAANLANANVQRPDGDVYQPLMPSFAPADDANGSTLLAADDDLDVAMSDDALPAGVRFAGMVRQQSEPVYRLDPENPLAAASGPHKGYVETSDVDPIAQMVGLVSAGRSYDANVSALQAAKQMDVEAIDIEQL
ncbi:MAG: flagellar basal body rod protein FlgC [Candidatus Eremiobacteraeota bacterium]|nr:flagellar basal body rod protein FlgC [Candidatus Eremiobacteraeota bacterium]MBV8366345.1 flagellar basal body rod protein FlgC [Candidatus Eremiobacteraeota bacterium]